MKPVLSLVCLDLAWLRAAQLCELSYEVVFFVLINFKFTKCFDNSYVCCEVFCDFTFKGVSHLERCRDYFLLPRKSWDNLNFLLSTQTAEILKLMAKPVSLNISLEVPRFFSAACHLQQNNPCMFLNLRHLSLKKQECSIKTYFTSLWCAIYARQLVVNDVY